MNVVAFGDHLRAHSKSISPASIPASIRSKSFSPAHRVAIEPTDSRLGEQAMQQTLPSFSEPVPRKYTYSLPQ